MEQQLVVMGIRSNPKLDPSSNVVRVLIDMYVDIGDHIALQYGGSEAHKKVTAERSESIVGPIGKVRWADGVWLLWKCLFSRRSSRWPTMLCFAAQRTSYFHPEILQQCIHRPIETRCNVRILIHGLHCRRMHCSDVSFYKSGISFWDITYRIDIRCLFGKWKLTITFTIDTLIPVRAWERTKRALVSWNGTM